MRPNPLAFTLHRSEAPFRAYSFPLAGRSHSPVCKIPRSIALVWSSICPVAEISVANLEYSLNNFSEGRVSEVNEGQ